MPLPDTQLPALGRALLMAAMAASAMCGARAYAQSAGCDQGVVRLPDSTGTVTICSALAAQVPQLARQLAEATRAIGVQGAQTRELTRLVKGLNAAAANLGEARQARMLGNLSAELARVQRGAGGEGTRRTLDELADQLDALRDQMITNLGQERSAAATRQALAGGVGDAISNLQLQSAARQLLDVQQRLAAIQSDVGEVKTGVRQANDKLDRIVAYVDPENLVDLCTDLMCAVHGGASSKLVRRLFERGARVPGNPIGDSVLLTMAAISRGEGRFETIDLLLQHGIDRDLRFLANFQTPGEVTLQGLRWARQIDELAGSTRLQSRFTRFNPTGDVDLGIFNDAMGCFQRTSNGITVLELAGLLGDHDLARHLIETGSKLPTRPLACSMRTEGQSWYARVVFDPATARVLGVKPN